jgi:hypothetical protein
MQVLSRLKGVFKHGGTATTCYHGICAWYRACLYRLSPVLLAKHRYRAATGRPLNLKTPETFDEKLFWLMLYWRDPLKTQCADKYAVRAYVQQHGWDHVLPVLLGVYENSRDIDFDSLPTRFVLKCTHGCGFNIICKDKASLDRREARRKLDSWMSTDFSTVAGEVHYASMTPRIICEPFLDDLAGEFPSDYKVYCFGGKAHCTLVCQGRSALNSHAAFDFYDREWKTKLPYSKSSLLANRNVPRPDALDEMIAAGEALSEPFPFVRMDFYSIQGRAVLGEMTFTPAGCIDLGYTELAQRKLGELIVLPPRTGR